MSQLKKGVALSYVTIFLTNIVGLFLTPFIVRSLGQAEYGLYTMIGALIGYMTVLDFGLNATIVRYVAKYKVEEDKKGEENFLAHSFIIYGVISLIILVLGLGLYFNLDQLYKNTLSSTELYKAKVMVLILIFNLAITLPGGSFKGIATGYEEFILPRVANIIRYVIRSFLILGLLLYGGDSIGIVVVDTIMNLSMIGVNAYIVLKKLKVKIKLHTFDKVLIKTIFGYSIWVFIFAIVHQMRWQLGQLILGLSFGTSVVAIYAIGVTLGNYYSAFSSAISGVLMPKAVYLLTKNKSNTILTNEFIKISRIILFVLLFIFGGFILIGNDFIYYWVGNSYSESYMIVIVIMFGLTLILSQGFANVMLNALHLQKVRGVTLILTTLFGFILGWYLSKKHEGLGMVVGTVVFMLIERVIMSFYYIKKLKLQMFRYYKETLIIFVTSIISIVLTYFLFSYQFKFNQSIKSVVLTGLIFFAIYFSLSYIIMSNYEKSMIKNITKKILPINKIN